MSSKPHDPPDDLREYLRNATMKRRAEIAALCDSDPDPETLRHIGSGRKNASLKLAGEIYAVVGVGSIVDIIHPQNRAAVRMTAA